MDPVTVLIAVGTTLKILKEVWQGLQWMHRVYETHTKGDKTLQLMALECNIYGESIKTIGQWLKKCQTATGMSRQMRTTHNAVTLVQVSMANVLLDLKKYQDSGDRTSVNDKKMSSKEINIRMFQQFIMKKAKLQWFQETMRIHLVELRAHAATLHLTLGVIDLTRHTPESRQQAPINLEDKTGKLEKRLLLRQFITKALAIKRAEIVELARRDESKQLPANPSPDWGQISPQKLTFYDVVQLARQQALAEKTQRSSEDLIDFSDAPQPVLNQSPLSSGQCDLELLDSSNPMDAQNISPSFASQNESEMLNLDQNMELTGSQHAIPEPNTNPSQKTSFVNLLRPVELQASHAEVLHEQEHTESLASAEIPSQPNLHLYQSDEALSCQDSDTKEKPVTLEPMNPDASLVGGLDEEEVKKSYASPAILDRLNVPIHQSDTVLIDLSENIVEALTDVSPSSTAAPSIFSHLSSLTGATGSSLPGITEEDIQSRNSSSQNNLTLVSPKSSPLPARDIALVPAGASILESPAHENDAELYRSPCISATPTIHTDLDFPAKPQRTQSEDGVSLSPLLPQISNVDEPDKQGFPWIVQAARDGDEQMIRKLLVSDADTRASHTSTRRHALSEASLQGHQKIVDLLIEEGCPLEHTDAEGNTALHHACGKGHLAVVKSLITSGAKIDALGPQGQSGLHLAMQVPFQNVVMLLIQHKANVNARDASFRTPLHIGASQGNVAMCTYLLNEGAQLDSREAQSRTPLQLACEAGHYELVQMMLNQSKLNSTNMTFLTAFFAAVEYGHVRIAEAFFPHGLKLQELKKDSYKPINLAAKSGVLAMVELMIQEDCDIHARDENGWNALHFASYHGHYQVIERLIAKDVSTVATTSRKETPLHFAVKRGHFAVSEKLLRGDEDSNLISKEDERGQQPIHHTVRAGLVEIFNLLMSTGAKINTESSFGWQPLHIATAYGHLALVERLLQEGANVEVKVSSTSIKKDQTHKIVEEGYWAEARWPYPGSRPLHLACEYGHDQIASHLISKGAKMETTCSEGWQPLHHAAYFGSSTLVKMLLEGGVNPHATTNEGKTAQALQFCTSGAPILDEEKERIRILLKEAMDSVRKQKSFKVALKRGSTVEEKNNLIRAATFSMIAVSRPHLHRAMSTTQASDLTLTQSDSVSSSQRPPMPHLPHTSPLPLTDSRSASSSHHPSTPHLPCDEAKPPTLPATTDQSLKNTETSTTETPSELPTANSTTNQPPPSINKETPTPTPTPTPAINHETQLSIQPSPKLKRKSTFGLTKVKPSLDISKLNLGSMGKPAFEIGKQTLDLGKQTITISKQTLELGKQGLDKSKQGLEAIQGLGIMGKQGIELGRQGIEMGRQGVEMGRQGIEIGKQGIEMGKQGFDMGKLGYKRAKKFAKKGKIVAPGKWVDRGKGIDGVLDSSAGVKRGKKVGKQGNLNAVDMVLGSVSDSANVGAMVEGNNDDDDNDDDDGGGGGGDDDDDDDAGSVFSLGEFADLGSDCF